MISECGDTDEIFLFLSIRAYDNLFRRRNGTAAVPCGIGENAGKSRRMDLSGHCDPVRLFQGVSDGALCHGCHG